MIDINQYTYNTPSVVEWYDDYHEINKAELNIYNKYEGIIKKSNLLDIGIGGGRTTTYLSKRCGNYIGIDYSEKFIEITKQKFPTLDIRCVDARNLSAFESASFDFINFSFNGIDYANLSERKNILSEINRVLKPNGLFFFSTHNKNHRSFNKRLWLNPENNFFLNLKIFLKLIPFEYKHQINKKKEIHSIDYSIINDSAHNYGLLTFYTTPLYLIKQLRKSNFSDIHLFSNNGLEISLNDLDEYIFAICKKTFS